MTDKNIAHFPLIKIKNLFVPLYYSVLKRSYFTFSFFVVEELRFCFNRIERKNLISAELLFVIIQRYVTKNKKLLQSSIK